MSGETNSINVYLIIHDWPVMEWEGLAADADTADRKWRAVHDTMLSRGWSPNTRKFSGSSGFCLHQVALFSVQRSIRFSFFKYIDLLNIICRPTVM